MDKTLALVSSWSLLALLPLSRVPAAGGCDPGPRQPPGREASVADTLPRCWPRASPVWPPLSDQEEGIPSLASPSFGHGVSLLLSAPDSTPFVPLLTGWVPCSLVSSPAHWLVPLLTGWFPCSLVGSGSPCSLVSSPWSWASPLAPIRPPHLAYGQQHLSTAPARLSSQTWTLLHVSGLEVSNASHSQYTQHHSSRQQADPAYGHQS